MRIGGGAPVSVQAMTNTNTADAEATAAQVIALAQAGAEMTRITVNTAEAAQATPEIAARMRDAGVIAPLIGDFHYNGHKLLREHPDCASALDKYRINPGNVGRGESRDRQFAEICAIARDLNKAVRIGVNAGSLDQELLHRMFAKNGQRKSPLPTSAVLNECMITSVLDAAAQAMDVGMPEDSIVLSCKSSRPRDLISLYRSLSKKTRHPLHLGLTEAGLGMKGLVWSASAMAILLEEGIGDTIRVSLTPAPDGSRCDEVYAAQELLQSLDLRRFTPEVTACPGCGRTTGASFQRLAVAVQDYVRARIPEWKHKHPGVEALHVAVMGCIVNGPGESRAADIGISLPGDNESPVCPVYADGVKLTSLRGTEQEITARFLALLETYIEGRYPASGSITRTPPD